MAIDSLQRRILAALSADGGFGVFDEGNQCGLLRRTLLWCRGRDGPELKRIEFDTNRVTAVPPSWSWMAWSGAIDYISPPFGEVKWDPNGDLHSPWSRGALATSAYTDTKSISTMVLNATAWKYSTEEGKGDIILDNACRGEPADGKPTDAEPAAGETAHGKPIPSKTLCIVLGKEHGRAKWSLKKHYVLIVKKRGQKAKDGREVCERIGAGWLRGECIGIGGPEPGLLVSVS